MKERERERGIAINSNRAGFLADMIPKWRERGTLHDSRREEFKICDLRSEIRDLRLS